MLPTSAKRTERSTPRSLNDEILRRTEASIRRAVAQGPHAIERRLRELDAEWDTERTLETMAASFALAGVALGATVNRRWYALSGVVAGFLLQHGLQGWCPPLPVLRALGVRTVREIDAERFALKLARGDFRTEPVGERASADETPPALRLTELQVIDAGTLASAASGA
ncbi:MAG TPA: YgaP-like transmembrane domain [Polyangiales bacterium]